MSRALRSCKIAFAVAFLVASISLERSAPAQSVKNRVLSPVDDGERSILPGSMSPRARLAEDTGELAAATPLQGMTMSFAPSAAQQADLEALIAAQGNPASPLFHQWLTPEQFGARFGLSQADLAKVEGWLRSQGFSVEAVSRSRNRITFSGTAAQVAVAFGAPLHTYREGTERHFAPSADLHLPSAFAAMVSGVGNLSDFRPRPHIRRQPPEAVSPRFTSSQTGNHFLTPRDIATLYDINPAYNAGYNGSGQTIAVVGQSSILTTDIANFRAAAGLPAAAPTLVLVPSSGTPTVYTDDESESDLDVEYAGGIAPGATILFVYVGNSANYHVFDALTYAVNERLAPVISVSYGECEAALSTANYNSLSATFMQAAAQGQTIVAASGDSGSTDCYGLTSLSTATQQALAVDFPASSPYVTGMGGTEFSAANSSSTNTTYWTGSSGTDVVSSVLSYIPEVVWNDDSASSGSISLSAGGGGASILNARPGWQAGVPGIPAGSFRLVPDVSLASSPLNVGYLYCSSDSSTNVSGSCSNGFRDVNNTTLTLAGGTSFAAPMFAGMVALINQARNSTGQGVVNPTLYSLASNAATYASAFHDITSGTNACTSGVPGCSTAGSSSFAATAGYDQATGLGSVDFYNLLSAWPSGAVTPAPLASTITLSAATGTPAVSTADVVTIQVTARSGAATVPTGTVSLVVDGSSAAQATLSGGTASYSFSSAVPGTHTIVATYSGDANYGGSTTTLVLTVGAPASSAAFAIAVPNISVTAGGSATSTVKVTASNGYSGTVSFTLAPRSAVSNFCYSLSSITVPTSASSATATLTIYTSSSACATAKLAGTGNLLALGEAEKSGAATESGKVSLTLAGLFGMALLGCRTRKPRPLPALAVLVGLAMGLSACSSSTGTTTSTTTANTASGTYSFTLTGTDTVSSALNSSTTFTVTVK